MDPALFNDMFTSFKSQESKTHVLKENFTLFKICIYLSFFSVYRIMRILIYSSQLQGPFMTEANPINEKMEDNFIEWLWQCFLGSFHSQFFQA